MLDAKTKYGLFARKSQAHTLIDYTGEKINQLYVGCFFIILCLLPSGYSLSAGEIEGNFFRQKSDSNFQSPEIFIEPYLNFESDSIIDLSGTWKGKARSGLIGAKMTFILSQNGDSVTGTWESPGAYPTKCGLWTGSITGNVDGTLFSFCATSPLKDLDTCEVICLALFSPILQSEANVEVKIVTEWLDLLQNKIVKMDHFSILHTT